MRACLVLITCLIAGTAQAHEGTGAVGGFVSGFTHPLFGWDHAVAMVAVGLWGAFLGAPSLWVLPVAFPVVMALGGALGVFGVPLPFVEIAIALSAVVLGLLILTRARMPLMAAGLIVAVFAIFHGHAHGAELPSAANPLTYAAGFVIATGLLHLVGIGFGTLTRSEIGTKAVRAGGAAISAVGLGFLFGVV